MYLSPHRGLPVCALWRKGHADCPITLDYQRGEGECLLVLLKNKASVKWL